MKNKIIVIFVIMYLTFTFLSPFAYIKANANPVTPVITDSATKLLLYLSETILGLELAKKAGDLTPDTVIRRNPFDTMRMKMTDGLYGYIIEKQLKKIYKDQSEQKLEAINEIAEKYKENLKNEEDILLNKQDLEKLNIGQVYGSIALEKDDIHGVGSSIFQSPAFSPTIHTKFLNRHNNAIKIIKKYVQEMKEKGYVVNVEWVNIPVNVAWRNPYGEDITFTSNKESRDRLLVVNVSVNHQKYTVKFVNAIQSTSGGRSVYLHKLKVSSYFDKHFAELFVPYQGSFIDLFNDPNNFTLMGSGSITSGYDIPDTLSLPDKLVIKMTDEVATYSDIVKSDTKTSYPTKAKDTGTTIPDTGVIPNIGDISEIDASGLNNALTDKYKLTKFIDTWNKLKTMKTEKGDPPKFTVPLKSLVDVVFKNFKKKNLKNPFTDDLVVFDFKYFEIYEFAGMSIIDYIRMVTGSGMIYITFVYCWRKLTPDNAH